MMLRRLRFWVRIAAIPVAAASEPDASSSSEIVFNFRGSLDTAHFLGRLFRTLREVLPIGSGSSLQAPTDSRFAPARATERRQRTPRRKFQNDPEPSAADHLSDTEGGSKKESPRSYSSERPSRSPKSSETATPARKRSLRSRSNSERRRRRSKTKPNVSFRKPHHFGGPSAGAANTAPPRRQQVFFAPSRRQVNCSSEVMPASSRWNSSAKMLFKITAEYLTGVAKNYFPTSEVAYEDLLRLASLTSSSSKSPPSGSWTMSALIKWTCCLAAEMLQFSEKQHSRLREMRECQASPAALRSLKNVNKKRQSSLP